MHRLNGCDSDMNKCKMYLLSIFIDCYRNDCTFSKCNIPCWDGIEIQILNIWSIKVFGLNKMFESKNPCIQQFQHNQSNWGPTTDIHLPYLVDMFHLQFGSLSRFDLNLCHTYFFSCCLIPFTKIDGCMCCPSQIYVNWMIRKKSRKISDH